MKNTSQEPSVAKPAHIENPKELSAKLRASHNKVGSELAAQAKKQAGQHQRLNKVAEVGLKKSG